MLFAPSNSRVMLVRKNGSYEVRIALRTGNAVIAKVPVDDLKIAREGRAA